MLVCSNCNNSQETGKFCGLCGNPLSPPEEVSEKNVPLNEETQAYTEVVATGEQPVSPKTEPATPTNQATQNLKNGLNQYGNYVINLLKNPSLGFQTNEKHFVNGLITLILYAFTFSLSVYFLSNSYYKEMTYYWGVEESLPFISFNLRLTFFIGLLVFVGFISSFVMTKVAKSSVSFQTLLAQYGSISVPFIAISTLAILTGLAGSVQYTFILLGVSYFLILFVTPALLTFEKASQVDRQGHRFYLSLATVILTIVFVYFLYDIIITDFIIDLERYVGYGLF